MSVRTRVLLGVVAVAVLVAGSFLVARALVADYFGLGPRAPLPVPATWVDVDGRGLTVTLEADGSGRVEGFPRPPAGLPCRTEHYEYVDGDVTWSLADTGGVVMFAGSREHRIWPARDAPAEAPWSLVRIEVCGSDRQGGDYRWFEAVE